MGYTNYRISAPVVAPDDLQQALGTADTGLAQLCKNVNINMWAKFKPVRKNKIDTTDQINPQSSSQQWKPDSDFTSGDRDKRPWWEADDGNYGLNYTDAVIDGVSLSPGDQTTPSGMENALVALAAKIDGGLNGWAYNKPRGGSSEPYRETDFNEYWHKAPNPVNLVTIHDVTASESSKFFVAVDPQEPPSEDPISSRKFITPRDVKWITIGGVAEALPLHMGFAIFKGSAPIAWVTDSDTWNGVGINSQGAAEDGVTGRGTTGVRMKLVDRHQYKILPFYCTESLSQPSTANMSSLPTRAATRLFTVPFTDFETFTAYQARTTQTIAWGYPSSHKTNQRLEYTSRFILDSTGNYYQGSSISFQVEVVITRLTWSQYDTTRPNPSTTGDVRFAQIYTVASLGADEIKDIGGCSNIALTFGEIWYCYIVIQGEPMIHDIMTLSGNIV